MVIGIEEREKKNSSRIWKHYAVTYRDENDFFDVYAACFSLYENRLRVQVGQSGFYPLDLFDG